MSLHNLILLWFLFVFAERGRVSSEVWEMFLKSTSTRFPLYSSTPKDILNRRRGDRVSVHFAVTYSKVYGNPIAPSFYSISPWVNLYSKDVIQGKLFQGCAHLLYCSVLSLGGNVNTRLYILVIGNYYVNYQNCQNLMLLTSSDTKLTLMHLFYSCLQIPPRENWFQYVLRVYAIAINFPCITFLLYSICITVF